MKKLIAILFGVVIAVVAVSRVETQPSGWLSILANDSQAAVQFRALSTYGAPVTIGHGTAAPTAANSGAPPMDGELYVTRAANTDPILSFYSQQATDWYPIFPVATVLYRDNFSRPMMVREEDYTVEAVTDAAMNIIHSLDGVATQYHFRIDGAQATPIVVEASLGDTALSGPYMIDMDNDAANTEGVQIVFTEDPQTVKRGGFVFGQTARIRVGVYIVDISDTSVLHFGFRLNEDYIDDYVLATQDSYVAWSSPAGTSSATSGLNTADDTELVPVCDIDDTTERIFEIQLSATGIGTFLCGLTEATLATVATTTVLAGFEAADIFVPYFAVLNGAAAGGEYHITFVELEYTDE